MREKLKAIQKLVVFTALFVFVCLSFYLLWVHYQNQKAIFIESKGQPQFGKKGAPLQMVLFEDFRCENCRTFMEEVFPFIHEEYIERGKAELFVIPLAFLKGSKDLANAALCIYFLYPEGFFPFLKKASSLPLNKAYKEKYLQIGASFSGLSFSQFQNCLSLDYYFSQIEQNFELAKKTMKGDVTTPSLYINGERIPTYSKQIVLEKLEKLWKEKV